MEAHGVRDAGLRQRLMDLYFNLACFPEVPAMLQSLKRAGLVTGILSNGSPAMLEAACKTRSEEHTSELQSLMRISYAVFCLKTKIHKYNIITLYLIIRY